MLWKLTSVRWIFCTLLLLFSCVYLPIIFATTLEFDGVPVDITSAPGEDIVIAPGIGGNTQIGTKVGANSNATSNNDLYITGVLEIDDTTYADGGILSSNNILPLLDSSYSLGSVSAAWQYLYVDTLSGYDNPLTLAPADGYNLISAITLLAPSGDEVGYNLGLEVNKTGGSYTGLLFNVTETAAPGASNNLFDFQIGGISQFRMASDGTLYTYEDVYVSDPAPAFDNPSADADLYIKGNLEVDGNISGAGIGGLNFSLDDAYDDGSTVAVDNTDVIWNLTAANFYLQDGGNPLLTATNTGLIGINTLTPVYQLDVNGTIRTGRDGQDGQLRIYSEQGGTDYEVSLNPHPAMTQNVTYVLPPDDGTTNYILITDGAGNLTWSDTWTEQTAPAAYVKAKAGGIATDGATLWGTNANTHINLGFGVSATGANGFNYSYATVGGGLDNIASNDYTTIGGGNSNTASAQYSTVGGGDTNTASGDYSFVGGGRNNQAQNQYSAVGGGDTNIASGDYAIVGGGQDNTASGQYSAVAGGLQNIASGDYSIVAGGNWLQVGDGSFGFRGRIGNPAALLDLSAEPNTFHIADAHFHFNTNNENADFRIDGDNADNVFFVDASTDFVGINRNDPAYELDINGDLRVTGTIYGSIAAGGVAGGWVDDGTEVRLETPGDEVGIGIATPDAKLEVLDNTGEQLRLTNTDAVDYASFTVDAAGDLTIAPSGGDSDITGTLTVSSDVTSSGNLQVDGNTTLGDAAADTITLNAAAITSSNTSTWTLPNLPNTLNIDANTFVIDGLNNFIGIRTNVPTRPLDIVDAANPQIRLTHTDTLVYSELQADAAGDLIITTTGDEIYVDDHIRFTTDNTYDIGAAGATRPRTGYFGTAIEVGNTHFDTDSLDFTGAGEITTAGDLTLNPANDQNLDITLSGTGDLIVNTDHLYVDTSLGFVGINRTDPAYELDVDGDLRVTGTIYGDIAAGGAAGGWIDDGASVRLQTVTDTVGIGIDTPDAKLEILETTEQLRLTNTDAV
ncbi:MAG: hypothetical protein JXD21_06875, partial [Candidatus Omnitrophica bacterium]|nr:hypothetical protein [Candidatus Omnitrophota bacterium]